MARGSEIDQLVTGLAKVGLALRSEAWRASVESGLSPTQQQVLALLRSQSAGQRLAYVAAGLGVTPATASECVRALVEKGLVRKERCANDARALALVLTTAGRREADARAQWPDLMLSAAFDLTPEERDVFLRSLVKMIKRLQDEGRIPVARMCASCVHFRPHAHPGARKPHHCAFVDAAFAERELRLDCTDHAAASTEVQRRNWKAFSASAPRSS